MVNRILIYINKLDLQAKIAYNISMGESERRERGHSHRKHSERIRLNERPMTENEIKGRGLTFWLSSHSKEGKREFEYLETPDNTQSVIVIRITHLKSTDKSHPPMTLREPPATVNQKDIDCIDEYIRYATSDRDSFDADIETSDKILFAMNQINDIRKKLNSGHLPTKPLV